MLRILLDVVLLVISLTALLLYLRERRQLRRAVADVQEDVKQLADLTKWP
jgi:hypothetical protein